MLAFKLREGFQVEKIIASLHSNIAEHSFFQFCGDEFVMNWPSQSTALQQKKVSGGGKESLSINVEERARVNTSVAIYRNFSRLLHFFGPAY